MDRYVTAFENADIAALKRLLTDDAVLEMPPFLNWFVGREAYGRFIAHIFELRGTDWRMLPIGANGQPALAAYVRGQDGTYQVHTLQVFTVNGSGISRNVVFQDPSLFATFGLPPSIGAAGVSAPAARAADRTGRDRPADGRVRAASGAGSSAAAGFEHRQPEVDDSTSSTYG